MTREKGVTLDAYVDDETVMSINDDRIRVDFVNIGEGCFGDYDPGDHEDENLLRFDVYCRESAGDEWREVDDASYCTTVSADTPREELEEKIRILFREYSSVADHILDGGSVKKLGETLSWI